MGANIFGGLVWLAGLVFIVWPIAAILSFVITKDATVRVKFWGRLIGIGGIPIGLAVVFFIAAYRPAWRPGDKRISLSRSEIAEYGESCRRRHMKEPQRVDDSAAPVVAIAFKEGWPQWSDQRSGWVKDALSGCLLGPRGPYCDSPNLAAFEYQALQRNPKNGQGRDLIRISEPQQVQRVDSSMASYEVQLSGMPRAIAKRSNPSYIESGLVRLVRLRDSAILGETEVKFLKGRTGDSSCPTSEAVVSELLTKALGPRVSVDAHGQNLPPPATTPSK